MTFDLLLSAFGELMQPSVIMYLFAGVVLGTVIGALPGLSATMGVALKQVVPVKPRVTLAPFRTFLEVEQPASEFILRLDNNASIGLLEADGGMWKLVARETIKKFLEEKLAEEINAGAVYIAL